MASRSVGYKLCENCVSSSPIQPIERRHKFMAIDVSEARDVVAVMHMARMTPPSVAWPVIARLCWVRIVMAALLFNQQQHASAVVLRRVSSRR